MHIRNSLATTIYRMLMAILAGFGAWMYFDSFGLSAWRIFATYALLMTAIYFGILAIIGLATKERRKQIVSSSMIEGVLIISLLTVSVTTFVFMIHGWQQPTLSGPAAALSYVTLPVLVIADWAIFMPKGRWQGIYPFYAAVILFTAELWLDLDLRYPLGFLDYRVYDISRMIWTLIFYAVCILIVGYGFYAIDALVSGKVGKHIVLPKIKLVEVESEEDLEVDKAKKSKPEKAKIKKTKAQG